MFVYGWFSDRAPNLIRSGNRIVKLTQITFISASRLPTHRISSALDELVAGSISRNTQFHVSGTLIYSGVHFAQLIEGSETRINKLIENILIDSRHDGCTIIDRETIGRRTTDGWGLRYSGRSTFVGDILSNAFKCRNGDVNKNTLLHQLFCQLANVYIK